MERPPLTAGGGGEGWRSIEVEKEEGKEKKTNEEVAKIDLEKRGDRKWMRKERGWGRKYVCVCIVRVCVCVWAPGISHHDEAG